MVESTDARLGVKPTKPYGWRAAVCVCDCGVSVTVTISGLVAGTNKSCGCLRRESVIGDDCRTAASREHTVRMLARLTPEQIARRNLPTAAR